jgi:hypothetical protein
VAADGAGTLQNGAKCPKGMRQQKRVVETPAAPAPLPVPAPLPAAPVSAMPVAVPGPGAPSATGAAAVPTATGDMPAADTPTVRQPPPMLYACLTRDAQRYYSEAAENTRCAPLDAVGLDGRSPAPAQACETVQDRCEPVPEAERCAAWAERRRVAEQALLFSPEQIDAARADLDHVEAALAGTACAR